MPLPAPYTSEILLHLSLVWGGVAAPCFPTFAGAATLTLEPGEDPSGAGAFYARKKLSGPLKFTDADYTFLLAIENSTERCLPIGFLVETQAHHGAPRILEYQGVFTCAECTFNLDECSVTVTPVVEDAYRLLLENWEKEYNILAVGGPRQQVTAQLRDITASINLQFRRIDTDDEATEAGVEGWAVFLRDSSWVNGSLLEAGTYNHFTIIFRYYSRAAMVESTTPGVYFPVNRDAGGWTALPGSEDYTTTIPTVAYTKTPEIAGFKAFKIGTYNDWREPLFSPTRGKYGDQLLVMGCSNVPSDYGYIDAEYIKITGPDGQGANNSETAPCLNLRHIIDTDNAKSVWWKFSSFRFARAFPLVDAIKHLLTLTVAPFGGQALVPALATDISDFFTAATNPATSDTGGANEVPRLLLSAASDVKRYGVSEPATRVMISLKQLIADLQTLYDVGWFIDPVTRQFRIEHRTYLEDQHAAGAELDLTAIPGAILPRAYSYRTQQLPRYEELTISNASTEDPAAGVYFGKAEFDYGMGGCLNSREGQNRTTRAASRLTGDVTAGVLSGDTIPDNALFLLAPGADGTLPDANRAVSASRLLQRYHRRGRAVGVGTVAGVSVVAQSVRPAREQKDQSVAWCGPLSALAPDVRLTTSLGAGGQLVKAVLDLKTRVVVITAWLPVPVSTTPAPVLTGRQFDNSFDGSFH